MASILLPLRILLIIGLLFCSLTNAIANTKLTSSQTILLPANFSIDTNIDYFSTVKPTLTLHPLQASSRTGLIWLGQTSKGLFIAGKIFGAPPQWPQSIDETTRLEHIELGLSSAQPVKLPPIGWINQFGSETLQSAQDCQRYANVSNDDFVKHCPQWLNKQLIYREAFIKLFSRQWQFTPQIITETYASPAYNYLTSLVKDQLQTLKPSVNPVIAFQQPANKNYAYSFIMFVPWNALPPMQQLTLDQLKLVVNVYNSINNVPTSNSSATPINKQQNNFNDIKLSKPQTYFITPCQYNLSHLVINTLTSSNNLLIPSTQASTYFFPNEISDIRNVLIIDNFAKDYQYVPTDSTYSPMVYTEKFFTKELEPNHILCGPQLAMFHNGRIIKSNFITHEDISTQKLPTGKFLLKDGPRVFNSYFGTGQCGACPRVQLTMYAINIKTNNISPAFNYLSIADPLNNDIDIHLTPHWKAIHIYEGKVDAENQTTLWQEKTYCLKTSDNNYQVCGNDPHVKEPTPRILQPNKIN